MVTRAALRLLAMLGALAAPFAFLGSAIAAVQVNLSPLPMLRFVDNNGSACSGCKMFTYAAGTTTKLAAYTDSTGATPNTNPIILDTRGEAGVWLTAGASYKIVLSPATDTDPPTNAYWTVDQVVASAVIGPLASQSTGIFVGPNPSATDWLTAATNNFGYSQYAEFVSFGQYIGITGAARLSANANPANLATIGIAGFGNCDSSAFTGQGCWGGYFEGIYQSSQLNPSQATGIEIDAVNWQNINVAKNPYDASFTSTPLISGLLLASGGGHAGTFAASAAILVSQNPSVFDAGIIFLNGSLPASASALEMPRTNIISWFEPATKTQAAYIQSLITVATDPEDLVFADNGQVYLQGSGPAGTQLVIASNAAVKSSIAFSRTGDAGGFSIGMPVGAASFILFDSLNGLSPLLIDPVAKTISIGENVMGSRLNLVGQTVSIVPILTSSSGGKCLGYNTTTGQVYYVAASSC